MNCAFPGDQGEREPKIVQWVWSMCSGSSIKSFGSFYLQFSHRSWYLTCSHWCRDIQNGYNMILECSLNIWYDYWIIGNLNIIPISAGLMFAHTSLIMQIQTKQITSKVTINIGNVKCSGAKYGSKLFIALPISRF